MYATLSTEIQESPQSLEQSGLFLFLRFKNTHEKSQTGTRKRQLWGQVMLPPYISNRSCPNARKAHGYRHSWREAPGKSLQADGWRRPLSGSCPDEAVDPIATPLPQSFDPLPLPKRICPADIGQHIIFDLGGCPCDSFPPLSPGYPKRAAGQ